MSHTQITSNLDQVRQAIELAARACGRSADSVRLLAVSKTHPADAIREAWSAGQRLFGENYAQELREKAPALAGLDGLEFHFIGHLQTNKAKWVAQHAHWVHSVDSVRLLEALSAEAEKLGKVLTVLFEVHLSPEESKSGCDPDQVPQLLEAALRLPGVSPAGLMTMPPWELDAEAARPYFARLRQLRDQLAQQFQLPNFGELSMGMSGDFPVAIQEGATLVRVGTAIFGQRDYR